MHYEFSPIRYAAREVAAITGVSEQSQRNWRARGFLPPNETGKHFRADVFDLAVLNVANLIADRLPVERAVSLATICGRGVARFALVGIEAWVGDIGDPFPLGLEHHGTKAAFDRYGNAARVLTPQYFFLWADGSELWDMFPNRAFDAASADQLAGPVLVLDLAALGKNLIARKSPLVMVKRVAVPSLMIT